MIRNTNSLVVMEMPIKSNNEIPVCLLEWLKLKRAITSVVDDDWGKRDSHNCLCDSDALKAVLKATWQQH